MKTKCVLIALLCLLLQVQASAQGENNIWTFAGPPLTYSGLDFNGSGPTYISSASDAIKASATVSDPSGHLLFYYDGHVYDRTHTAMPSGGGLHGDPGARQGAAIAPVAGTTDQYYLFTLSSYNEVTRAGGLLSYSIVDMSLNGGLGDINPLIKNIRIDSGISEKMIIAGDCKTRWLLVHHPDSGKFYAYNLAAGVGTPVISYAGVSLPDRYVNGEMKITRNNRHIALVNWWTTELYDFDNLTGNVRNYRLIDSSHNMIFSLEFSPSGEKLYVSSTDLYQYDLSAGSIAAIRASKYVVHKGPTGSIRLGPDGMIYVCHTSAYSRIRSPEQNGMLCDFELSFMPPGTPTPHSYNFGNRNVPSKDSIVQHTYRTLCKGSSVTIDCSRYDINTWSDGSSLSVRTFSTPGTYWVRSAWDCGSVTDTIIITEKAADTAYTTQHIKRCGILTLSGREGMDDYLWSTGAVTRQIERSGVEKIWVAGTKECSLFADTFYIDAKPFAHERKTMDTVACNASALTLSLPGFHQYLWSGGNKQSDTIIRSNATVRVIATDTVNCRVQTNEYTISLINFTTKQTDTFICNGASVLLDVLVPYPAAYTWGTGETSPYLQVEQAGVQYVSIQAGPCLFRDTITVTETDLKADIGGDQEVCAGKKLLLKAGIEDAVYQWSTGASTQEIEVMESGTYRLNITKGKCSASGEAAILFVQCSDCISFPSAFTPNGDGINDRFKPLLNCAVHHYQLNIFNRWGQQVFTTNNLNESWDGTANGRSLEGNVYFYLLQVKYEDGERQNKIMKGDVTLIR